MTRASRRGFALPVLLLALFGAAIVWGIYATRLVGSFDQRAKIRTETALHVARDALLQYSAYAHTPGTLPCPATDNSGTEKPCAAGAIGRLPWKTLGIDPPLDGSGECIWYALSGGARTRLPVYSRSVGGDPPAINPGWPGSMTLHDHASGSNSTVIAVLFAPGPRLSNQTRQAGDRCNLGQPADFLESLDGFDNASGTQAVRAQSQANFNDAVLAVTAQDLYAAVVPRVLIELAGTSESYGFRGLLQVQSATFWGTDGGHPLIDFTSPVVQAAFPQPTPVPPPGNSPFASIKNGCTTYDVVNASGQTVSAAGVYSIEWLCFNQWTQYIQFQKNNDFEVLLSEPQFGWQVIATPYARTKLTRTHQG